MTKLWLSEALHGLNGLQKHSKKKQLIVVQRRQAELLGPWFTYGD